VYHAGAILAQDGPSGAAAKQMEDASPTIEETPVDPEPQQGPFPCSYTGRFVIASLGCPKTYLSYIYPRCDSLRVTLLNKKQLREKPYRAAWTMNGAYFGGEDWITTPMKSYKRSDCSSRYLQTVPGTNMRMGTLQDEWVIQPVEGSSDCYSSVSLYSEYQGGYLSVASSCNSFSFKDTVGLGEMFELKAI
jgi:hypothetical protein